jgi:hypothetical protein
MTVPWDPLGVGAANESSADETLALARYYFHHGILLFFGLGS